MRSYYVYILSSRSRTLYIGVTNDVPRRLYRHRTQAKGFTGRYSVHRMVYVEFFSDVRAAIAREKQLKGWKRVRKLALITTLNPGWDDLASVWRLVVQEGADPSLRSG